MAEVSNIPRQHTLFRLEQRKSFQAAIWMRTKDGPLNITGTSIKITVIHPRSKAILLEREVEVPNAMVGYARLSLQAADLDLPAGEYPFALTMLNDGFSGILVKGTFQVEENAESGWVDEEFVLGNPTTSLQLLLGRNNTVEVTVERDLSSDSIDNTFVLTPLATGDLSDEDTFLVRDESESQVLRFGLDKIKTYIGDWIAAFGSIPADFAPEEFVVSDATGDLVASGKAIPSGDVVGTTDAQALSSKSLGSDLDADGHKITDLSLPDSPDDAANKGYVDNLVTSTGYKEAVRFGFTQSEESDPTVVEDGDSIGGVTAATGDRFLFMPTSAASTGVKQAAGIYVVGASGSTRATDWDTGADTFFGMRVVVLEGTFGGALSVATGGNGAIVVGTTAVVFSSSITPIASSSAVVHTPSGNISSTNVQAAIEELDSEKQASLAAATSIPAAFTANRMVRTDGNGDLIPATVTETNITDAISGLAALTTTVADNRAEGVIDTVAIATAAATAAKTTTSAQPATGSAFTITLTNGNTVTGATLNFNGAGARTIYVNGSPADDENFLVPAGAKLLCRFDGTNVHVIGGVGGGSGGTTMVLAAASSTAAATAAKTTTTPEPAAKSLVLVVLTNGNSASAVSLSFNGGTARNFKINGATTTASNLGGGTGVAPLSVLAYFDGTDLHVLSQDQTDAVPVYTSGAQALAGKTLATPTLQAPLLDVLRTSLAGPVLTADTAYSPTGHGSFLTFRAAVPRTLTLYAASGYAGVTFVMNEGTDFVNIVGSGSDTLHKPNGVSDSTYYALAPGKGVMLIDISTGNWLINKFGSSTIVSATEPVLEPGDFWLDTDDETPIGAPPLDDVIVLILALGG